MAKWDKKYFVTELRDVVRGAPWSPVFADNEARRLLSLDGEVIPGAFYMETAWFFPGDWPEKTGMDKSRTIGKHVHEFDEVFAWVGTDTKDPYDLGGELDIYIDGKKSTIDRSFICFIPAGVEHGPINIRKITKPMFHFTAGMGKEYRK